jgi:hypothetical protein
MMGTPEYFKKVAELHSKFSVIEADFNNVIQTDIQIILSLKVDEKREPDWKLTREVIDRFDKNIEILKGIKSDLEQLRTTINKRGAGFFKYGSIKDKMQQVLSIESIQNLKTEMKACVNALKKADTRKEYMPFKSYLQDYQEKYPSGENGSTLIK